MRLPSGRRENSGGGMLARHVGASKVRETISELAVEPTSLARQQPRRVAFSCPLFVLALPATFVLASQIARTLRDYGFTLINDGIPRGIIAE